mmetsp:Transcript_7014/g.12205  ORF Transcript_7014/g.12205 Transcript_7014/m.12205 type:complete len:371 (-) Transcript_7014:364-1476(-)
MKKSWADEVSSDEDEDYETMIPIVDEPPSQPPISTNNNDNDHDNDQEVDKADDEADAVEPGPQEEAEEEQPRRRKEYELPDGPPFTAFIGNLAFSVKEPDELGQRVSDLLKERFQKDVKVVRSRVAIDRREKKHRGFGYVEVETLDDLKAVLELDDGKSVIAGRPIHLDVAQPHASGVGNNNHNNNSSSRGMNRGPSLSEVDGASFRGGRYNKQRSTSFRRSNSTSSENGGGQRQSLKLQPRTKAKDETNSSGSNSNIFGDGKAREGGNWTSHRSSSNLEGKSGGADKRPTRPTRNTSGTGSGRGGRNSSYRRQSSTGSRAPPPKKDEGKKVENSTQEPQATQPPQNQAQETKKVINKFAALDFGDSDSD